MSSLRGNAGVSEIIVLPILAAASLLVAFFAAEFITRAFDLTGSAAPVRFADHVSFLRNDPKIHPFANIVRPDPDLFWKLEYNQTLPDTTWPFVGVISNDKGLRECSSIPYEKPRGEYRALFLGDSCTFGYGVREEETFVNLVEQQLCNASGRPVQCINGGVPGYSIFQGWQFLQSEGMRYEPDVLVVTFGWNEMDTWDDIGDIEHHEMVRKRLPPEALRWSRVCHMMWAACCGQPKGGPRSRMRVDPEEYVDLLDQMREFAEAREIDLIFVRWPFRVQYMENRGRLTPYQIIADEIGKAHDIPVVDLIPVFESLIKDDDPAVVFFDKGHARASGHEAAASALAPTLAGLVR